jgi:hypothetical protein
LGRADGCPARIGAKGHGLNSNPYARSTSMSITPNTALVQETEASPTLADLLGRASRQYVRF